MHTKADTAAHICNGKYEYTISYFIQKGNHLKVILNE